jgi:integrase
MTSRTWAVRPKRSMFSKDAVLPTLKPISVTNQKECVRWVASALVHCGIKPDQIRSIRDLIEPGRYQIGLDSLAVILDGPTPSVENAAIVLAKIAKYSGTITPDELKTVQSARERVGMLAKLRRSNAEDPDQKVLDQLDANPEIVDALLTLPYRIAMRVSERGGRTYNDALKIQRALILAIWLCTSFRLRNMRYLQVDLHFFKVVFDGVEYVVIRIPRTEVKNRRPLEHFLNQEAVDLLNIYLNDFLPILTKRNPSKYLFPGRKGQVKAPQVFRSQMKKFIRDGTGLNIRLHAIRKITTKIYLDEDPGGIEVARRNLGDTEETTRAVYAPRVHRASQRKYLDGLENRRLMAFSSMMRFRKKRKG